MVTDFVMISCSTGLGFLRFWLFGIGCWCILQFRNWVFILRDWLLIFIGFSRLIIDFSGLIVDFYRSFWELIFLEMFEAWGSDFRIVFRCGVVECPFWSSRRPRRREGWVVYRVPDFCIIFWEMIFLSWFFFHGCWSLAMISILEKIGIAFNGCWWSLAMISILVTFGLVSFILR